MYRKQKTKTRSPLIRLVGLEAAVAVAGSLAAATIQAAPGDLDPAFGDAGRQSDLGISSTLWSTDLAPDGSIFASGGEIDCDYYGWYYYECSDENFSSRLLSTGAIAADFLAVPLENSVVYDAARQADGRLVEVGRVRLSDGKEKMQVSRRLPDGTLDPGFGLNGKVWIDDGTASSFAGRSVIVDADQRIVVAGTRGNNLAVVRLLPDGALDPGFAGDGKFLPGGAAGATAYPPRVAAAPGGGYRVASNTLAVSANPFCAVTALDEAGVVGASFGESGVARAPSLPANTQPVLCGAMAIAADGSVLLGGQQGSSAYLQRLRPDGSADPGFSSGAVASHLNFVYAIAAPAAGAKVYAAGYSSRSELFGAPVLRLQQNGTLDAVYGQGGIARVLIRSGRPVTHYISDLQPGPADTLVVGGNAGSSDQAVPFVARLLGDTGPGGPGLLSLQQDTRLATEFGPSVVLKVGRVGGSTGAVAVSYRTRDLTERDPASVAIGGADYTAVAGRLTWGDGDVSEREITVPIAADTIFEQPEFFEVVLEAAEGGSGLATSGAEVEIAGGSYPGGMITMTADAEITEGTVGYLLVNRSQYSTGVVSVTVRVAGGTATAGSDFGKNGNYSWQDVLLTWADGEIGGKFVPIYVKRDGEDEVSETAQFELVAPTGGASLDPGNSQVVVTLINKPQGTTVGGGTGNSGGGGGGGGSFGWLGAALLGLAGLTRRLTRRLAETGG
jgi:uncharacterized delta-60 repeat protein